MFSVRSIHTHLNQLPNPLKYKKRFPTVLHKPILHLTTPIATLSEKTKTDLYKYLPVGMPFFKFPGTILSLYLSS